MEILLDSGSQKNNAGRSCRIMTASFLTMVTGLAQTKDIICNPEKKYDRAKNQENRESIEKTSPIGSRAESDYKVQDIYGGRKPYDCEGNAFNGLEDHFKIVRQYFSPNSYNQQEMINFTLFREAATMNFSLKASLSNTTFAISLIPFGASWKLRIQ